MTKHTISWSINGKTEIDAADAAEAQAKFNQLSIERLAKDSGDLVQHDGPYSDADLEEQTAQWLRFMDKESRTPKRA
mgnify:CR=1 FL=1